MLHPTYEEIKSKFCKEEEDIDKVENSKFSMVIATARRARQIIDESNGEDKTNFNKEVKVVENGCSKLKYKNVLKPVSMAIDEIYNEDIKIVTHKGSERERW